LLFLCNACFSLLWFFKFSFVGPPILVSRLDLSEEGPIDGAPAPADSEAPEASENQDGDEAEGSLEESDSNLSPSPANSEEKSPEKKWKRTDTSQTYP
jgi:hypothetical protein